MKYIGIILAVAVLLVSAAVPARANTRQENNKNIADFVLDTVKLPLYLLGALTKRDHEQVKSDLNYQEHRGLNDALRGDETLIGK